MSKVNNPTPALKARITDLANQVKSGLDSHYHLLSTVAPQLEPLIKNAYALIQDDILLPSRLTAEEVQQLGLASLLREEMHLRIGHAYDSKVDLKNALGMQSFWAHHMKSQYSSQMKKTKGQANYQASVARVREAARAYNTCYDWIIKCAPVTAEKFGLKPLLNTDLVLLSEWKDSKAYKRNHSRLPWIWRLRPIVSMDLDLELPDGENADDSDVDPQGKTALEIVVEGWRNECE